MNWITERNLHCLYLLMSMTSKEDCIARLPHHPQDPVILGPSRKKKLEDGWHWIQLKCLRCCIQKEKLLITLQSTEQIWEGPHYKLCKDVRLQELNMSSPPNYGIQVSSLQGDVKIDITPHEHTMLRGRCSYLVQAII